MAPTPQMHEGRVRHLRGWDADVVLHKMTGELTRLAFRGSLGLRVRRARRQRQVDSPRKQQPANRAQYIWLASRHRTGTRRLDTAQRVVHLHW